MSDTPHIKRFEEWEADAYQIGKDAGGVKVLTLAEGFASKMMLNDLAEHVERLERQFETHFHYQQENSAVAERNGYEQLENTGTPTTGPVTDSVPHPLEEKK